MIVNYIIALFSMLQSTNTETFWVSVDVKKVEGSLYIAVYNDGATFLKPHKQIFATIVPVNDSRQEVRFDLPPGKYAISVFQDLDKNGKLSTGLFGIPQEPYGFSNNVRGFAGPPNFEECIFDSAKTKRLAITLK